MVLICWSSLLSCCFWLLVHAICIWCRMLSLFVLCICVHCLSISFDMCCICLFMGVVSHRFVLCSMFWILFAIECPCNVMILLVPFLMYVNVVHFIFGFVGWCLYFVFIFVELSYFMFAWMAGGFGYYIWVGFLHIIYLISFLLLCIENTFLWQIPWWVVVYWTSYCGGGKWKGD